MCRYKPEITDKQWEKLRPLFPEPKASPKGGPKPIPNRPVFEGIVWLLRSGARWKDMPREYPSPATCWRRLWQWEEDGTLLKVWHTYLSELDEKGRLKWEECFADGSFAPAKKGGSALEKPNAERVRSLWWWQTARVFLWECTLPRPHQMKSRSSKPRWSKWLCRGKDGAVREKIRRG